MSNGDSEQGQSVGRVRRWAPRWRLLTVFVIAFTLVFAFLGVWVAQFATSSSLNRLQRELATTAKGTAAALDGPQLARLIATVPPVPDPSNPTGLGYPPGPLYLDLSEQLYAVSEIVEEAGPYSYYRDPGDGRLYFAASAGYVDVPQSGVPYKVPVDEIVNAETYALMEQGLDGLVLQDPYTDAYGSWVSAYAPVYAADGVTPVGAVGIDFPLTYVEQVRTSLQNRLLPILGIAYVLLLLLVLVMSTALSRPLVRARTVVDKVAEGRYDVAAGDVSPSRFPAEVSELADSLAQMAAAVEARQGSADAEIVRLRAERDGLRRDVRARESGGT